MSSPTVENYLKAMLSLADEEGRVTVSTLARALDVSTPTVNAMTKRLRTAGLVAYERYRPLALTAEGRRQAALVVRKHRLTEMFLVERMGFGWEEVHAIAEQIEHVQSPAFFERMDTLMGSPTVDPHGSPIPDLEGNIDAAVHPCLADRSPGEELRLVALADSSDELLRYLNARALALGTTLTLVAVEPFDRTVEVSLADGASVTLSRKVSECLLVEPV